jgi:hypothetical protein
LCRVIGGFGQRLVKVSLPFRNQLCS